MADGRYVMETSSALSWDVMTGGCPRWFERTIGVEKFQLKILSRREIVPENLDGKG